MQTMAVDVFSLEGCLLYADTCSSLYIYIFFYQTFVSAAKEAGILTGSLRELTVSD